MKQFFISMFILLVVSVVLLFAAPANASYSTPRMDYSGE